MLSRRLFPVLALLSVFIAAPTANAQLPPSDPASPRARALEALVDRAAQAALTEFAAKRLLTNELAITLVDLRESNAPVRASYRGTVPIYPASVIKLFYLVAAHRWMEDNRLRDTPELRRAMKDMIVESYNEATHYIVDLLTDTTSGPELPDAEIDAWFEKRNAVNRYFTALGYTQVNANKKPWCEGPYGRETQSIKRHQPSRNMLTTDETARLVYEIVAGRAVTRTRSAEMLELMRRDPYRKIEEGGEPDQSNAFTGFALKDVPGVKLWSKAGWTSQVRHDAAYVELANGARFILVVFTTNHSNERGIVATVARTVVTEMAAGP